jgi:ABC-type phosphate transport system substrate-binding protein
METSASQGGASLRRRIGRGTRIGLVGLGAVVLLLAAQVAGTGVAGASPAMQSTGSSFAGVAIQQWVGQASTLYGLQINWQVSSSVVGLNNFAQNQVDFGASDIPYSSQQATYTPNIPYQYLPDVAGGLSFMYNLNGNDGQRINGLVLNSRVTEQIFLGEIDNWNDPAIAALNPQLGGDLPNQKIIPVYRADASGENYLLSDYFLHQDAGNGGNFAATQGIFQSGLQGQATAIWPVPAGGVNPPPQYPGWVNNNLVPENGSDNAANYVSALSSNGAITYVETAYAKEHNLPVASLMNASGNAVQPTSVNVATALEAAILHPDLTQDLSGVYVNTLANAYPLSAYSYFVTPCSPALAAGQGGGASCVGPGGGSSFPASKGQALGVFENFIACAGQQKMDVLGYSPLPPNLVDEDFAAIGRLNGATQPAPVPLNGVDPNSPCRNPYVDGQIPLPGEPIIQGLVGGGGGINGGATAAALNAGGSANAVAGAGGGGAGGSAGGRHGAGGSGNAAGGIGSTKGLTAQQIAEGYRVINGQIVKVLPDTEADKFKRAGLFQTALIGLENSGLAYLGWALLVLAVVCLPPLIIARRNKGRGPKGPSGSDVGGHAVS